MKVLNSRYAKLFALLFLLTVSSLCVSVDAQQVELSLVIESALKSVPSDGKPHPAFYITIKDSKGAPRPQPYPVNVTVACSDDRILQVADLVVIEAAGYYTILNATSTVSERSTVEITVSSTGFKSSKLTATVEPPAGTPKSLDVALLPDTVLPKESEEAVLVVTLMDAYGKPTRARADINVTLTSSNLQIGNVLNSKVTIKKDEYFAKTKVICTGFPGTIALTASATGLGSDSSNLNVVGPRPEKIYIWTPTKLVVNEQNFVFVATVDANNRPVKLFAPVQINLYSSNTPTITVQPYVTIGVGEWCALASIKAIALGSAEVFASSQEFVSSKIIVNGYNSVLQAGSQVSLKVYSLAGSLPADGVNLTYGIVQATNSSGYPILLDSALAVDMYSTSTDILEVRPQVTIQATRSYANITMVPKYQGTVKVSPGASNVINVPADFTVYTPIPSSIKVLTAPIPSDAWADACLLIYSGSTLVEAQTSTRVDLTSSTPGIAEVNTSTTVPARGYLAYFKVLGKAPGTTDITAAASGWPSSKTKLTVNEVKPSTFVLSFVKPIVNYDFPLILQMVSLQNIPAAAYVPVVVNLASSNASNAGLPPSALIEAEWPEVLIKGTALAAGTTTLTVSSEGFKSLTQAVTPAPISLVLVITAASNYVIGDAAKLRCTVTLEGTPVRDIYVYWNGTGIQYNVSITDAKGVAETTLLVQPRENWVEAYIKLGDLGKVSTRKMIYGTPGLYTLTVNSNVGIPIEGSGTYSWGTRIPLIAQRTVGMGGFWGLLGGKYQFRQWTGAVSTTNNVAEIVIGGDVQSITVTAVYDEDLSSAFMMLAVIAVVVAAVVGFLLYWFRFRKPKVQFVQA